MTQDLTAKIAALASSMSNAMANGTPMEIENAQEQPGAQDVRGDPAQDKGQGEGGTDSAVKDGAGTGNGKKAKRNYTRQAPAGEANLAAAVVTKRDMLAVLNEQRTRVQDAISRRKTLKGITKGKTTLALQKMIARRMREYRVDALDAIYTIATMSLESCADNSMMVQVKLAAARILAFPNGEQGGSSDTNMNDILRDLNTDFHAKAPRIKAIRERTIEFEQQEPKLIN